jgi:hypothetical protein
MGTTTPIYFFELFVLGNSEDYHKNPGCLRRAFNASLAASHLADHYYKYNKSNKPAVVSKFNTIGIYIDHLSLKTNGAFRDIRSIANAYKHLYTNINPQKTIYNIVSSPGVIESIKFNNNELGIDTISMEFAPKGTIQEKIFFTRIDGSKSEFLPILDIVVDYWKNEICKIV